MPSRTTVTGPTSVDWQIYPDRADMIIQGHDRGDMIIQGNDRADLIVGDRATLTLPSVFVFTPPGQLALPNVDEQTGNQFDSFSLLLPEATGGTGSGYVYSVSGLPRELTFDPATRTISGTLEVSGTFTVTYSVVDSAMSTASDLFNMLIAAYSGVTSRSYTGIRLAGSNTHRSESPSFSFLPAEWVNPGFSRTINRVNLGISRDNFLSFWFTMGNPTQGSGHEFSDLAQERLRVRFVIRNNSGVDVTVVNSAMIPQTTSTTYAFLSGVRASDLIFYRTSWTLNFNLIIPR